MDRKKVFFFSIIFIIQIVLLEFRKRFSSTLGKIGDQYF